MGQETLSVPQPDCPYPAFQEISIEQIERMRSAGLRLSDWKWTDIQSLIVCPYTKLILVDRDHTYRH